jgi:hypothetical protein
MIKKRDIEYIEDNGNPFTESKNGFRMGQQFQRPIY